jgi:hypothetical protein
MQVPANLTVWNMAISLPFDVTMLFLSELHDISFNIYIYIHTFVHLPQQWFSSLLINLNWWLVHIPCGGRVEYLHCSPPSHRRRLKGKSQI